jgi:hypothetical protein
LLAQPEIETTEGKRDRAIPAAILGWALRRSERAALECRHIDSQPDLDFRERRASRRC